MSKAKKDNSPAAPGTFSPEDFFTRNVANEGIRLDLTLPDGSATGEWIQVRGMESDEYRRASSRVNRRAMEIAIIEDEHEREEAMAEAELELRATLVVDWSFPWDLTKEKITAFLREAPQISDEILRRTKSRALFYSKKKKAS